MSARARIAADPLRLVEKPKPAAKPDVASFTSRKIDLLKAVMWDSRLRPYEKLVIMCIIYRVNEKTRCAFMSDAAIVDEVGGCRRLAQRARVLARNLGYLAWKRRPYQSNVYFLRYENIAQQHRIIATKSAARPRELTYEERKARKLHLDQERAARKRAERGAIPRASCLSATEPWKVKGVSRRTWYREQTRTARGTDSSPHYGTQRVPHTPKR